MIKPLQRPVLNAPAFLFSPGERHVLFSSTAFPVANLQHRVVCRCGTGRRIRRSATPELDREPAARRARHFLLVGRLHRFRLVVADVRCFTLLVRSSVHRPIYRWVNPLLLLLWFGYFLIIQFRHPILLPFFDDYTGFLDDYSLILSGNYPLTRIEWLWQTYWECRVPIPRLLFILLSACFGNQVFLAAKLLTTLLLALVGYLLLLHTEARKNR